MSAVWRDRRVVSSAGRRAPSRHDLDGFNRQVLACQDQAFTLAVYLLGDEPAADAVVAQAVREIYTRARLLPSIRVQLLGEVLPRCGPRKASTREELRLHGHERDALLLVDMLGLCYDEAAQVLGCSHAKLTGWLAAARQRLVEQDFEGQVAAALVA
jgi:predicted DNA-binding protein (UPF0251 family)